MSPNTFSFSGRSIGPEHPPLIIAEIGINHEGDLGKAFQMIEDAKKAREVHASTVSVG